MNGEASFADAAEALDTLERDRQRVRRRIQRANIWYFPALGALVALLVASPAIDGSVLPAVVAAALLIPLCTLLYRKHAGVSDRIEGGLPAVVVVATALLLLILGLFLASALSPRFGVEAWVPAFALTAFAAMVTGGFVMDAVVSRATRGR